MPQRIASQFHIEPALRERLARAGLDRFDALMGLNAEVDLHKPGLPDWRQRVAQPIDGETCYLKRYRQPPLTEQIRQRLRGFAATADIERRWIEHLGKLGIGVAPVLAYGWQQRLGWERASLLLLGEARGQSLEKWVDSPAASRLGDRRFRHRLSFALADLVRTLHGANLFHRDLYLCHVFIDVTPDDEVALTLIDLQRVIRPMRRRRWVIKDLAALNYSTPSSAASRSDRLRWFKRYLGVRKLRKADRQLLRAIQRRTEWTRRRDHDRQSRRR